jgi:hypothetical protein
MNPLLSNESQKDAPKAVPSLPVPPPAGSFSNSNRRVGAAPATGIYPWLLFASTAVAATFCLAYITKPVILADAPPAPLAPPAPREVAANVPLPVPAPEKLLPDTAILPGDDNVRPIAGSSAESPPAASVVSDFEETNIRVQHILDAESPSGDINRIIVDVPVLYRSRNLRWSQAEAADARKLLARLNEHQQKTRSLRDEGKALLDDWNALMDGSIPSDALRADSPSLPANQHDPLAPTGAAVSDTIETIQLSHPNN